MKTKNTYLLLLNSEEKGRGLCEGAVYGLVVASMAFAGLAFAFQTTTASHAPKASAAAVETIKPQPVQAPLIASRN